MEYICIFSTNQEYQISLVQKLLYDKGIESHFISKKDSSYLIGEIELFVKSSDEDKARELIKSSKL